MSKTASLSEVLAYINTTEQSGLSFDVSVKISVLRNFTVEGIEPFLKYHCIKSGIQPEIVFGNYDMVRQEVLDPTSHIYSGSPEIIVTALFLETYLPDAWRAGWNARDVMHDLSGLFSDLALKTGAIIAINNFMPPFFSDYGIANSPEQSGFCHEVQQLNGLIREFVRTHPSRFVLVDWERIVRLLGEDECMDYRFWYMSKAPFKKSFLDLYARELVKIVKALKGKARKCLILDCDNTLWGGIVGEDGLDGVKLDRHNYPGNVYYDFQKSLLRLHERGVLLALCSKNNEQDVWELLDNHPDCLLKREHLSAWRVNWKDKASNIKELASELNLGLDSFVFVDDNAIECGLIREMIPDVLVLTVPEKLYLFPTLLQRDGLFDTLTLSAEDRQRSRMYRDELGRKEEQARFASLEQYLESLSILIDVHHASAEELPRITQLTQKTNQFNLTTRRYSEAQIVAYYDDPAWAVISLSVRDKFGDSGLTGVLIARHDGAVGRIDSFLMSCRVLGRNIEVAFVLRALEILDRSWKVESWQAEYIPTKKNLQVKNFWQSMGFREVAISENSISYELFYDEKRPEIIPYIKIEE